MIPFSVSRWLGSFLNGSICKDFLSNEGFRRALGGIVSGRRCSAWQDGGHILDRLIGWI